MKKIVVILYVLIVSTAVYAQKKLGENQHYATLIYPDGNESEVVLLANLNRPWLHQQKIFTVDKNLFESLSKIKNKDKIDFKAGDLKGYKIGSQLYETQKYADVAAGGPIAALPKDYFMEVAVQGKITVYKFYAEPERTGSNSHLSFEELEQQELNNPFILILKEGQKLKETTTIKIENYFGDNERVMEKYNNGEYGNMVLDTEKKGLGKLVNKIDKLNEDKGAYVIKMAEDYNKDDTL